MEGSASVRKSLSGTLVPVTVTTMAMIQQPEENDKGKLKRKVLDEEEYIENLEKIIQRDFFPDVTKLQAQKDYLDAEETGDLERMREISIRYGSSLTKSTPRSSAPYVTPASFETPVGRSGSPTSTHGAKGLDGESKEDDKEEKELPCLDRFLAKNTSEDNASFEQIMDLAKDKEKLKHSWLYEAEAEYKQRHEENLALPSVEKAALECVKAGLETWEYKAKNALMYYPEGVKDDDALFKKPREVVHKNTRFSGDPFSKALNKSQIQQAAALNAQFKQGKVGPDGKELIPHESPTVNGYGFETMPSPAPGVTDSPLMTWGEIESTPFRLDGSDSPYIERNHGPSFKIPEPGRRERLGLKMANEAAIKNRAKKQEALRKVTENLASLTPKGLSPALTPALQRLVNRTSSKYTDKALRASYTPSPSHSVTGCKSPFGGPATPTGTSGQPSMECMPSFASEWDEIEKIMNLIGAGIETSKKKQPTPTSDGACGKALDQPVGEWLEHVGLPQYESKFLLNGFDDLRFMGSNVMEDQDLRDIGITDPGHRKKILHAARSLPKVKALGCDGSTSLASWLDGLGLHEYLPNFLSSGYRTLECVKNLWELEIVNVIKIGPLGHRKRIIASLAERPYEEAPSKSRRLSPIMFHDLLSQTTSPLSQMDPYTSRSMDMLLPLTEPDRRRRDQDCSVSLRSYSERPRSVDRQSERHKDSRLNLRPPSHSATYATVSAWHHQPEKLILDSCGYEATYLGSMIIRDLRGIESTQEACAKIRKSKDSRKGPVVILSITYRGVKFIDAATKAIVAEHEIRNISCAAQDPDDLCTFAYITKDLKSGHHFCHVFSTVEVTQTYEIILTLGQAFEVAYQMAIQSRARHYVPPTSLPSEVIETKSSRPVSQSWSSMRRSAIDPLEMDADMQSLGSTTWLLDQRDSNRRPVSTKYETTIF